MGRCIYCGAAGPNVGLSDEHIIAYGLGGRLLLPKASCAKCAKVTGRIETAVLQQMWEPIRTHLNIRSRKKRKRKSHLPVWIDRGDGHKLEHVPVNDHPWMLFMHIFENLPGLLVGKPEGHGSLRGKILQISAGEGPERIARLGPGIKGIRIKQRMSVDAFALMLAKIAHSYAVAVLGIDYFEHFLPPTILGKPDQRPASSLIGGELKEIPRTKELYEVGLRRYRVRSAKSSLLLVEDFYVCRIRLFSYISTPEYFVVVGKPLN